VRDGYRIDYEFPKECKAPVLKKGERAVCKAIKGFKEIECSVFGDKMSVTMRKIDKYDKAWGKGRYEWTVNGVRNPQSIKPSSSFVDITLYNKENIAVASYTKQTKAIRNIYPSYISTFNLT
jgi:hypothetical protein